jgi:hypothetical protein
VVCGSGWKLGFIAFFVLPEGSDVAQVSWEGEVSPWPVYHLLGLPAVHPSLAFCFLRQGLTDFAGAGLKPEILLLVSNQDTDCHTTPGDWCN